VGSLGPTFFSGGGNFLKFDQLLDGVREALGPILQAYGLELADVEYRREAQGWVLRVFIDREGGVSIDDCAQVSGELGTILDVREIIPNPYTLEVSSPGLTRSLKTAEDFQKYSSHLVKIRTFEPVDGRRNFKGTLLGLEGDLVRVMVDGQGYGIPLKNIAKANLEIEL
jgi:ribosome maturation factor RimP